MLRLLLEFRYILWFSIFILFPKAYSMDLLQASEKLNDDRVRELLESGNYDVEEKNSLGQTALFLAVKPHFYDARYSSSDEREKQKIIIELFLGYKARTDVVDIAGRNMYFYAQDLNWRYLLKFLPAEKNK